MGSVDDDRIFSYQSALSLVSQKRIDVQPLITHRFSFSEAEEAFEMVRSGKGLKVMIQVGDPM